MSYVQVAYRGGHVSFVGGKRIAWVYDITALTEHQAQVADQEPSFVKFWISAPPASVSSTETGGFCFTTGGFGCCSGTLPLTWIARRRVCAK